MTEKEYTPPVAWSSEEDAYLKKYYGDGDHSAADIGKFLDRSRSSVIGRAKRLGITAKRKTPSLRKF